MSEMIEKVALAICKSRTCEGGSCCQWPANRGRVNCNAKQGAYDEAARAAIEAMPGWQPIETAPKDGSAVMIYGPQAGEISGPSDLPCICLASWTGQGDYEGFEWSTLDGDYYTVWVKPTHWQPMPAPPAALKPEVQS